MESRRENRGTLKNIVFTCVQSSKQNAKADILGVIYLCPTTWGSPASWSGRHKWPQGQGRGAAPGLPHARRDGGEAEVPEAGQGQARNGKHIPLRTAWHQQGSNHNPEIPLDSNLPLGVQWRVAPGKTSTNVPRRPQTRLLHPSVRPGSFFFAISCLLAWLSCALQVSGSRMLPLRRNEAQQGKQGGERNAGGRTDSGWLQRPKSSLKFNRRALWPTVLTAVSLLDGNSYPSHQSQHPGTSGKQIPHGMEASSILLWTITQHTSEGGQEAQWTNSR